jgi:carboxypeptidase family protein
MERHGTRIVFVAAVAATLLLAGCSAVPGAGTPGASPTVAPLASGSPAPGSSGKATSGVRGKATAGPVCPVERVPADPACAPRPVVGAVVVVRDGAGTEVGRATTGPDGTYVVPVPPGPYTVTGEKTQGMMRAPGPQPVTVAEGMAVVDLSYDTGIR